jgi:hypothetical protein
LHKSSRCSYKESKNNSNFIYEFVTTQEKY